MTSDLSTTEAAIISRIATVMGAVSNIGNVYTRERWAALLKDQRTIAVATIDSEPVLRFWTISLKRIPDSMHVPTRRPGSHHMGRKRMFEFQIIGVFGHNDSDDTETPAKIVVMDVMNALDEDATLNATYWDVPGCMLDEFRLTQFGPDLVHYAEITCRVESAI